MVAVPEVVGVGWMLLEMLLEPPSRGWWGWRSTLHLAMMLEMETSWKMESGWHWCGCLAPTPHLI